MTTRTDDAGSSIATLPALDALNAVEQSPAFSINHPMTGLQVSIAPCIGLWGVVLGIMGEYAVIRTGVVMVGDPARPLRLRLPLSGLRNAVTSFGYPVLVYVGSPERPEP